MDWEKYAGRKEEQVRVAREYGEIIDIPFPEIPANASEGDIAALADENGNLKRESVFEFIRFREYI